MKEETTTAQPEKDAEDTIIINNNPLLMPADEFWTEEADQY